MSEIPLLIEFVPGTCLLREEELAQGLPILQNGSPGTFIVFPERFRVSLPTDQIVYSEDRTTGVRVGFGGMRFVGMDAQQLVFHRVHEMHPEEQLSPMRSQTMRLNTAWVASVAVQGTKVWTR